MYTKTTTAIIVVFILLWSSCATNNEERTGDRMAETQTTDTTTLQYRLDKRKTQFNETAPESKKELYQHSLDEIKATGILQQALSVGDTAPDFVLNNQLNERVELYEQLNKGPVVLTWYRGGWCPYCNITLHYLQEKLPEMNELGATLMALSPELPDSSLNTAEKHQLDFHVLSDVGNIVGKKYGIVYQLPDKLAESYQNSFDLHAYNGDSSDELPLPATYIIDKDRIVRYAFVDVDYRRRAEPEEIIKNLKLLTPDAEDAPHSVLNN